MRVVAKMKPSRMMMRSSRKIRRKAQAPRRKPTERTSSRTWKSKSANAPSSVLYSDYQAKPELDRYEAEGIDDEGDHAELDYQARRDVERLMD